MLRPRILSNYNFKRQDGDKKEKDNEMVERKVALSQMKKVQPNYAGLTMDKNNAGSDMEESKTRFEMGISVSEEQSVTCTGGTIVQTTTQHSINVIQLVANSSTKVYQLVPESSERVAQGAANLSIKAGHMEEVSLMRVGSVGQNSSLRVGKLGTSHSSGRVVKLAPHSSTRVAHFVPNSSTKVARLVSNSSAKVTRSMPNSTKKIPPLVPTSLPILSRVLTNSIPRIMQLHGANSQVSVAELISNPSTNVMRLVSNSSGQELKLTPTSSPKIGQTVPRSPKKVPPLIKFSPAKASGLTPNSPTSSVPRVLHKPSIKSIQRFTKANSHNFVMIMPVSGKEETIVQSQTASTSEIIENSKDVARVQQVIGIPRQYSTSESNSPDNNPPKLGIVALQVTEAKHRDNVPTGSCTKSENNDNIEIKEEFTETHEAALPQETIEEEKVVTENEKPDSTSSKTDLLDIAKKVSPPIPETDRKSLKAEVEPVDAKEMTNKPESSRKRSKNFGTKKKQSRTLVSNKKQSRATVSSNKKMEEKVSTQKTTRMMTRMKKSTILMARKRNTRTAARPNQTKPKMSALSRMQGQITKTLASLNPTVKNQWRAQCIICKDRFTDKYEFHRHLTLSHPGIRIVFCELCNASFRSDIELKQHRYSYHKITVTKDAENNLIKLESPMKSKVNLKNEPDRPRAKIKSFAQRRLENSRKMANNRRGNLEPIAERSNEHIRSRPMRKIVTASNVKTEKSKGNSQLGSVVTGPRKKKSLKQTMKSKHRYVDIDIIHHKTITNDETFVNAEIRKLIIPIVRLDGLVLEKYLMKFVKKPVSRFAGINKPSNPSKTKNKPTILSEETLKSVDPRSNKISERPATRLILRNRRKAVISKKVFEDEQNVTISDDPKIAQSKLSYANRPALRRSLRSRKESVFDTSTSDENSSDECAKIKPSNDAIEAPKNKESQKLGDLTSENSRSSQDFTLIDIEDEPEAAKIVEINEVEEKRVPLSSVSICSTPFYHNHDQDESDRDASNTNDIDMKPVSLLKQKSSMHSGENDSELELVPKDSGRKKRSAKPTWKSSLKLEESRSLRARASKSTGSDEKSIGGKRATKPPRLACENLYDNESSMNSDSSKNRDGESDETSNKQDKRAVVNKKIREKNSIVSSRDKRHAQTKGKGDGKNKLTEEKIDGEDNQEKNQSSGDGKNLDEKSTDDGKQNNGSVNEEKKHSKAKSILSDKLGKKQSDDEDEEPKRRINDEGKKPKEKIQDEDDEKDKKPKDDTKRLRGNDQDQNTKYEKKSKCEQLNNSNDPSIENQPEFNSDNGDNEKCSNDKNDAGLVNKKETENSLPTKTPIDSTESSPQKTYSSSRKSPKVSKQAKKSEDTTEKIDNFCSVCKKLCALMKKVSSQVGDRNTTEIPIKCPLCQRYFISTFHLELHVATNHLQCENDIPCKIAEAPSVKKASPDIQSDSKSKADVMIECLRCSIKLNTEKELNDHLIAKHKIRYSKVKSSTAYPEYIRDIRTSSLETKCQKIVVTASKSREETVPNSSSETNKNKMLPATTLDCSLCDEKFVDSTKYVRHVREIHNVSKTLSSLDEKRNSTKSLSTEDKLCSLSKEPLSNVSEASSTVVDKFEESRKTEKVDPATSDRDYVLKQLLSDDSSSDEGKKSLENNRSQSSSSKGPAKENIVQKSKGKNAVSSKSQNCEIGLKTFDRRQYLLSRRLSHVDKKILKDGENGEDRPKTEYEDRSEVFVQSDSEDEDDFRECDNIEYDEFSPAKEENVFVYHKENERDDNVAVLFGTNGASEKVVVGSKRRATLASYEMSQISKDEKTVIPVKTQKISDPNEPPVRSVNPKGNESQDAGRCASKESLEMEVGPTDESNEKLPIACDKCNRHFANRSLLNEHLFFLHDDSLKDTVLTDVLTPIGGSRGSDETDSPRRWTCETCVQNFKLFQGYSRHRYFVHGDDSMVHVCDNCSKVMTNVTMVNVHICTDVASFNCRTCNETFTSGMSLRLHNTEKHMETNEVHNCEDCKKNFLTNGMLERHISSKHRFVRPYRARKSSSACMAKLDLTKDEDVRKPLDLEKHCDEEINESPIKGNVGEAKDSIMADDKSDLRRGKWRSCRSKKKTEAELMVSQKTPSSRESKKEQGRMPKTPVPEDDSSFTCSQEEEDDDDDDDNDSDSFEEHRIVYKDKSVYVDETEIHQCALCQLFCLSRSTLRNHMTKIHSVVDEICQLCQKMYPTGKLIRHMIERHITPDDGEDLSVESSWRLGADSNEIDAEILIKMLGIDRLVSLCEYRRFSEKINLTYPCVSCKKQFSSHELYRYHFLLHHDTFCALCNIEFKTGHDAARHKIEVHGSVGRYIWFADRTILALTSTKNFTNATESIFMERITREEKAGNDEPEEMEEDEEQTQQSTAPQTLVSNALKQSSETMSKETILKDHSNAMDEETVTTNEKTILRGGKSTGTTIELNLSTKKISSTSGNSASTISSEEEKLIDDVSAASVDFTQPDDVSLIIVVTDDDLERFNITTRYPNIWGLSAKISSTYNEITPKQVKEMLECHFEREEDFDT